MLKPKKIIQFGHKTLRQNSAEVPLGYINSSEIKKVVADLKNTIPENGIGLAAPQINQPWRIFVADISKEKWSDAPVQPSICINPKIISSSSRVESDWEGCLSAPGIWGKVERPYSVKVEYYDETGQKITADLGGVAARVFQHELDHLNGVLFVDRMKDMTTLIMDEEFDKIRDNERV